MVDEETKKRANWVFGKLLMRGDDKNRSDIFREGLEMVLDKYEKELGK